MMSRSPLMLTRSPVGEPEVWTSASKVEPLASERSPLISRVPGLAPGARKAPLEIVTVLPVPPASTVPLPTRVWPLARAQPVRALTSRVAEPLMSMVVEAEIEPPVPRARVPVLMVVAPV